MKIVVLQVGENNLVEVFDDPAAVIPVTQPAPQIVDVVSVGPQGERGLDGAPGPKGDPGPPGGSDATHLLGVPISFVNAQADNLLAFNGSAWVNRPQPEVTDGGNW